MKSLIDYKWVVAIIACLLIILYRMRYESFISLNSFIPNHVQVPFAACPAIIQRNAFLEQENSFSLNVPLASRLDAAGREGYVDYTKKVAAAVARIPAPVGPSRDLSFARQGDLSSLTSPFDEDSSTVERRIVGEPGERGAQGARGARGARGQAGADGTPGTPGRMGIPGRQGQDGEDGAPGAEGATGRRGPQGAPGVGEPGLRGPQGPPGVGAPGPAGPAGPRGAPGPAGTLDAEYLRTFINNLDFADKAKIQELVSAANEGNRKFLENQLADASLSTKQREQINELLNVAASNASARASTTLSSSGLTTLATAAASNMGVGTMNPLSKLDIQGARNANGEIVKIANPNSNFYLGMNETGLLGKTSAGSNYNLSFADLDEAYGVGFGTTKPESYLHIHAPQTSSSRNLIQLTQQPYGSNASITKDKGLQIGLLQQGKVALMNTPQLDSSTVFAVGSSAVASMHGQGMTVGGMNAPDNSKFHVVAGTENEPVYAKLESRKGGAGLIIQQSNTNSTNPVSMQMLSGNNAGLNMVIKPTTGDFVMDTVRNGGNRPPALTISQTNDYIGLGNAAPTQRLSVAGNIAQSGNSFLLGYQDTTQGDSKGSVALGKKLYDNALSYMNAASSIFINPNKDFEQVVINSDAKITGGLNTGMDSGFYNRNVYNGSNISNLGNYHNVINFQVAKESTSLSLIPITLYEGSRARLTIRDWDGTSSFDLMINSNTNNDVPRTWYVLYQLMNEKTAGRYRLYMKRETPFLVALSNATGNPQSHVYYLVVGYMAGTGSGTGNGYYQVEVNALQAQDGVSPNLNVPDVITETDNANGWILLKSRRLVNEDVNGNVGIGVEEPTAKLDVNGNAKVRGTTIFQGESNFGSDVLVNGRMKSQGEVRSAGVGVNMPDGTELRNNAGIQTMGKNIVAMNEDGKNVLSINGENRWGPYLTFNTNGNQTDFDIGVKGDNANILQVRPGGGDSNTFTFDKEGTFKATNVSSAGKMSLVGWNSWGPYMNISAAGDGATDFDIGVEAANRGVLQFRPNGTNSNMMTFNKQGNLQVPSISEVSDIRKKTNIRNMPEMMGNKIMALRPVLYQLRDDLSKKQNTGLVAQEVEKVLPELVETDKDGMKSVNYTRLNVYLLKAIQEQQKQIQSLLKQNRGLNTDPTINQDIKKIKESLKESFENRDRIPRLVKIFDEQKKMMRFMKQ